MLSLLVQILKGKGDPLNPKIILFFIFVDLEKAFDLVLRKVICFTLRQKGVRIFGKRL